MQPYANEEQFLCNLFRYLSFRCVPLVNPGPALHSRLAGAAEPTVFGCLSWSGTRLV